MHSCLPREQDRINLDYAASTPLRSEALEAMRAYDVSAIAGANPNSLHTLGRAAAQELERARGMVAASLGARVRSNEIIFTGGGTEANAMALFGIAEGVRTRTKRSRILVSAIEHDSVLDNIASLRSRGFTVETVPVCAQGYVEPQTLAALMDDDVALVSIMLANNETGVVQPIRELSDVAHAHGACFHTDAIQGYLHIPFDVGELGVDALSVAAHKVGGPVCVGALYLKGRTPFAPLIKGGGQEFGKRPGTQDLRSIVAFAAVAELLASQVATQRARVEAVRDELYAQLLTSSHIAPTVDSLDEVERLPGIVSIVVAGMDSEELILQLDAAGFEVSAGSACSSASLDPSHVLRAMGIPARLAFGSLRISFDDRVAPDDVRACGQALLDIVERGER